MEPADGHGPILIVEDDEDIRESIADILRVDGYRAITAENGQEALEILERQGRPCVILLDLMMPVMGGVEFLARMKANAHWEGIPVVVMTAVRHLAQSALGATECFLKPLDINKLIGTVQKYC